MKNTYIIFLLFIIQASALGQVLSPNWLNQYDRVSLYQDSKITPLSNNEYLLLHGLDYIILDTDGDSLSDGIINSELTSINAIITSGNEILVGGISTNGPTISKLNMNLDTVWNTTIFPLAFSRGVSAIYADGSDIYVGGSGQSNTPFISKLNMNGDTIWNTNLQQSTFSNLTSIIKLNDGNFLASGNVDDYPLAIKFDSSGDTIWTYQENIFISFTKANAFEKSNGDIVLIPHRKFITLNSSGTKISESDFTLNHYLDIVENGDTIYLIGSQRDALYNGNSYPIVEVRNRNLDSLGGFIDSTNIYPLVSNRFSDGFLTSSGALVVSGVVRDSVNIIANTWNLLAAKFNGSSTTSIKSVHKPPTISVYPNPTKDLVYFNSSSKIIEIQVINSIGKTVRNIQNHPQSISLEGLPSSTYFLRITTGDGVSVQKLFKF